MTRRTRAARAAPRRIRPARRWPSDGEDEQGDGHAHGEGDGQQHRPEADPVAGADHGDGGEHRAGTRDEDQAEAEAEDEPAGSGLLAPVRQPGERPLQHAPDGGTTRPRPTQTEHDQADPSQQVLGQAEGAQQPRPDQGEDREAEHQAGHHGQRAAAAPGRGGLPRPDRRRPATAASGRGRARRRERRPTASPPAPPPARLPVRAATGRARGRAPDGLLVQAAGRPGGEDDRQHREDARRDPGDQATQEPDDEEE